MAKKLLIMICIVLAILCFAIQDVLGGFKAFMLSVPIIAFGLPFGIALQKHLLLERTKDGELAQLNSRDWLVSVIPAAGIFVGSVLLGLLLKMIAGV
ncbi:MAG: hypothetical protein AB8F65_07485 [Woeseiaceae bacterium]